MVEYKLNSSDENHSNGIEFSYSKNITLSRKNNLLRCSFSNIKAYDDRINDIYFFMCSRFEKKIKKNNISKAFEFIKKEDKTLNLNEKEIEKFIQECENELIKSLNRVTEKINDSNSDDSKYNIKLTASDIEIKFNERIEKINNKSPLTATRNYKNFKYEIKITFPSQEKVKIIVNFIKTPEWINSIDNEIYFTSDDKNQNIILENTENKINDKLDEIIKDYKNLYN